MNLIYGAFNFVCLGCFLELECGQKIESIERKVPIFRQFSVILETNKRIHSAHVTI